MDYTYPVVIGERDPACAVHGQPICAVHVPDPGDHQWVCTLPRGHDGPHVAHLYGKVLAIGPYPLPDYMRVSEGL